MHTPRLLLLTLAAGCGSQRVQGYLDDLADCSASTTSSTTGTTEPADTTSSTTGTTSADTTAAPDTSTGSTAPPDTDASSTSDSSTGDPPTVCGDGILDPAEECDDGNLDPGDGCSELCTTDIRVFVSSMLYEPGDLEGVHLADASCANLAAQTGDPTFIKYRAWLSDSTTDARDHIKVGRGRIVLVNGLVVAESWDALLAGELQLPIDVTEKSETYHGGVWTGTRPDGTAVPGANNCDDWTSHSVQKSAYYGESYKMTGEWTLSESPDNPDPCALDYAIYCFKTL